MLKLNIKQNALHSLHHAIGLIHAASSDDDFRGRVFNDDDHFVEWYEDGRLQFSLSDYTPLPPTYSLKFVLLHLIQAVELVLKAYIADIDPQAIFIHKKGVITNKTIGMYDALKFIEMHKPGLLSDAEKVLLGKVKDLRNNVEHHEFEFGKLALKQMCIDFLALSAYLTQSLLSINLLEIFDYDALRDRTDPVSGFLQHVLSGSSILGKVSLTNTGRLWAEKKQNKETYLCMYCNERSLSAEREVCMGCGVESTVAESIEFEKFEALTKRYIELKNKIDNSQREKKKMLAKIIPISKIK